MLLYCPGLGGGGGSCFVFTGKNNNFFIFLHTEARGCYLSQFYAPFIYSRCQAVVVVGDLGLGVLASLDAHLAFC